LNISRTPSQVIAPVAGKCGLNINPFPVSVAEKVEAPWNIHRLNLDALPAINISEQEPLKKLSMDLIHSSTDRELSLSNTKNRTDTLLNVKGTIQAILSDFSGSRRARVFPLHADHCIDTIIFVTAVRLDLASHGFVADAQVLTLSENMVHKVRETLSAIDKERRLIEFRGGEAVAWKQLLPALVERCRTWKHGRNCEYLAKKKVPLSLEYDGDPLCSCGKGKDVTPEFLREDGWKSAIPFVTRIAIGPLYGVPYAENVGGYLTWEIPGKSSPPEKRCQNCGGLGKPRLLVCSVCKVVSYCSPDCQKLDWKAHKGSCRKHHDRR
jgi:hypothetical protein